MSHFTVMVSISPEFFDGLIVDVESVIVEMLEPYCEQTEDSAYLEFNSMDEGEFNESKNLFDVGLVNKDNFGAQFCSQHSGKKVCEVFDDFESFILDYYGYSKDEETGLYGYTRNPNAKWDWWVIGGRWRGMLSLLPGTEGMLSEAQQRHGIVKVRAGCLSVSQAGGVDVALFKDIDFDSFKADSVLRAVEDYDKACKLQAITHGEVNEEEGDSFLRFDVGQRLAKDGVADWEGEKFVIMEGLTKAKFIQDFSFNYDFSTCAVLNEKGWHESAEMGWWGTSGATSEDKTGFQRGYYDTFFKEAHPDTVIAIVDCHV